MDDDDPDAWMFETVGRPRRHWPTSAAEMAAAIGYGTWASAWQCDETTDDLVDFIGGVSLGDSGTPLYRQAGAFPGDFAVSGDDIADEFLSTDNTAYDITTTGTVALYCCIKLAAAQADYLMGKTGTVPYYSIAENASGHLRFEISDGTTTVQPAIAVNHFTGGYVDVIAILDRTGGEALIASNLGVSTTSNISALLTLSSASVLRLGISVAANFPTYAFAAVATGGITALKANVAAAITNIRRFTGR